jgi:hypothetical protein
MRCFAANHAADGDQRVESSRSSQLLGCDRQFERAGHFDDFNLPAIHARIGETFERSFQQTIRDEIVKFRDRHAEAQRANVRRRATVRTHLQLCVSRHMALTIT